FEDEITIAGRPAGQRVAGLWRHFDVTSEQVGAAVHTSVRHLIEEEVSSDSLADKPTLHIGHRGNNCFHIATADQTLQVRKGQHAEYTTRPHAMVNSTR